MKRKLTYEEVRAVIDDEDRCGVNNLLQELFSSIPISQQGQGVTLGKHCDVMGEFNSKGELEEYEVVINEGE